MSYRFQRYKNAKGKDCISVSGVDFEGELFILKENEYALLCRWAGGNSWAGIGTYKYRNPNFIIMEKVGEDEIENLGGRDFEYNRQTKKEVFKKACEMFNNLGKEKDNERK
jgi:hypothetical protein